MTILTKSTDKKKLLPIPTAPITPSSAASQSGDVESLQARSRARTATLLVFLIAFLVLLTGIFAGVCFYRQYLRERVQRLNCFIPYSESDVNQEENFWVNSQWQDGPTYQEAMKLIKADSAGGADGNFGISDDDAESLREVFKQMLNKFQNEYEDPMKAIRNMETQLGSLDSTKIHEKWFKEELEVKDDDVDSYADINIPDFKEGRQGRFIHDFRFNQSTIVDEEAKRCFVYPLDYETTLPPTSMTDVFKKMNSGYYFPDTSVLRKKKRVVFPELEATDERISGRAAYACRGMKVYQLEDFVSGVYKLSIPDALDEHAVFAVYAGKQIVETDLVNLDELKEYEKSQK